MCKKLWNRKGRLQGAKGSLVYTLQKFLSHQVCLPKQGAAERLSPKRWQGLVRGDVYSPLALSRSQSTAKDHSHGEPYKTTSTSSAGCPGTPSIQSVVVCFTLAAHSSQVSEAAEIIIEHPGRWTLTWRKKTPKNRLTGASIKERRTERCCYDK